MWYALYIEKRSLFPSQIKNSRGIDMAVLKCKMCGGSLSAAEGMNIVQCEFCGTAQTVPSTKDENLQNLFNRANVLRMQSEFDKAEEIYEKIVQEDSTQAEAYWGLILCKFGIEYVEDPATKKRIPTCHRTSLDSIVADVDYKSALTYANSIQRILYESEAKEIDRLQKEILAVSQKEEPCDVFICYKETDENGQRTPDSAIANDIYYQLTEEGFKVFFAAITLEDKLGSAYEPCIFAALNSAKVMLAIGTKPAHFNAVWVKNEWSRFLKIMKNDRSKMLIPCYKDMDAYELPDAFAHLQAQDMSKIGFINDLVRGIKKVIPQKTVAAPQMPAAPAANSATAPLLQRAFMFLEDSNWASADEYCEKVLDLEPLNAMAYLGKLMAQLKIKTQSDLVNNTALLENNANYQKALRFADPDLKSTLEATATTVRERLMREKLDAQKQQTYENALTLAKHNNTSSLEKAISLLRQIQDWKDAPQLIAQYESEISRLAAFKDASYNSAMLSLENGKRFEAGKRYAEALNAYQSAQKDLLPISDYKDSQTHIAWCERKLEELGEISNPTLLIQILDNKSPLALADGTHYVYNFTNKQTGNSEQVIVDLGKRTTTHEMKLAPGDYSIELNVYGWNTPPGSEAPIHKASVFIHLSPFDRWSLTSNRPGMFAKLQMTPERTK